MSSTKIPGWGYLVGECRQPLSRSVLWELQRKFYERVGLGAWTEQGIPSYVTSNAWVARRYARLVHTCLLDWAASGRLDPTQPLHVVELASGSGEFAFRLLVELTRLLDRIPPPEGARVRVVLTDFAESNLAAWEEMPRFHPFLDSGLCDLAHLDAESSTELRLRCSGDLLAPETLRNPLLVFANYLFDSLPQDAYVVREGALQEQLVTVTTSERVSDPFAPEAVKRLRANYEEVDVDPDRYGDAELDAVLSEYSRVLPDGAFLLPVGGIGCLRRLLAISQGSLLLLVTDKGYTCLEELSYRQTPHMALHRGCFSLMVNYHALEVFCAQQGGRPYVPSRRDDTLVVGGFLFGDTPLEPASDLLLEELVEEVGPNDYHQMVEVATKPDGPTVLSITALLRLSGYDPQIVVRLGEGLAPDLETASESGLLQLRQVLERTSEGTYWEEEETAVADLLAAIRGLLLVDVEEEADS